jgi:hypothetical protein
LNHLHAEQRKSFNYSGLPSTSPLYPICTCLSQSQSLFCLDISPLIYLFVSSSSISPKLKKLAKPIISLLTWKILSDFFMNIIHMQKMTGNECLRCNSTVRPRQEAMQCDNCLWWQHRVCGKKFKKFDWIN